MYQLYQKTGKSLNILIFLVLFYFSIGFYFFVGIMTFMIAAYIVSEYLVFSALSQYRDLLDDQNKIAFDTMTKDEKIKCLDELAKAYNHKNIIYIKDSINNICGYIGQCF